MKETINAIPFFESGIGQANLLPSKLYGTPNHHYIVSVKLRLQKAMEKAGSFWSYFLLLITLVKTAYLLKKKVGEATKENTIFTMNHWLIDEKADFFKHHHNAGRDLMLNSFWDTTIKVSTDPYYEWLLRRSAWRIVATYLRGDLPGLGEPPLVLKRTWRE